VPVTPPPATIICAGHSAQLARQPRSQDALSVRLDVRQEDRHGARCDHRLVERHRLGTGTLPAQFEPMGIEETGGGGDDLDAMVFQQ
jgi:hypothetical protein